MTIRYLNYDQNIKKPFNVTIIRAEFNKDITQELLNGTIKRLKDANLSDECITVIEVPGAVEIPLVAQTVAAQKRTSAIIALGAVVRGETTHYDYVCQQVSEGCQKIMLEYGLPVIFGVLTTENSQQAWARLGGSHGHKGVDAAECALVMQQIMEKLQEEVEITN